MWRICLLFAAAAAGKRYLPNCRFDQEVIGDDAALNATIALSEYVFSGRVIGDVVQDDEVISFAVSVKRYFKDSAGLAAPDVRVVKTLRDGEGVKCRQVVRPRFSAIFVGRKPQELLGDVQLAISPVPVTLRNLERVDAATKGIHMFSSNTMTSSSNTARKLRT